MNGILANYLIFSNFFPDPSYVQLIKDAPKPTKPEINFIHE